MCNRRAICEAQIIVAFAAGTDNQIPKGHRSGPEYQKSSSGDSAAVFLLKNAAQEIRISEHEKMVEPIENIPIIIRKHVKKGKITIKKKQSLKKYRNRRQMI